MIILLLFTVYQQEAALCPQFHPRPALRHVHPESFGRVHQGCCPVLQRRHQPLHPLHGETPPQLLVANEGIQEPSMHRIVLPLPLVLSCLYAPLRSTAPDASCPILTLPPSLSLSLSRTSLPARPLSSSVTTVSWPIFSGSWWRRFTSIPCCSRPSINAAVASGALGCWVGVRNPPHTIFLIFFLALIDSWEWL